MTRSRFMAGRLSASLAIASSLLFAGTSVAVAAPEAAGAAQSEATTSSGYAVANTCTLTASAPYVYNSTGYLRGVGGRSGCTGSPVSVAVAIKVVSAFSPDGTVGSARQNMVNGSLTVTGPCRGRGQYYVETNSSTGAQTQSDRPTVCS